MEESHQNLGEILGKADVEMQEEAKMVVKSKKDIAMKMNMADDDEDENASDDSGEGVDSDDLDDEIQDNVEELVLQQ